MGHTVFSWSGFALGIVHGGSAVTYLLKMVIAAETKVELDIKPSRVQGNSRQNAGSTEAPSKNTKATQVKLVSSAFPYHFTTF